MILSVIKTILKYATLALEDIDLYIFSRGVFIIFPRDA